MNKIYALLIVLFFCYHPTQAQQNFPEALSFVDDVFDATPTNHTINRKVIINHQKNKRKFNVGLSSFKGQKVAVSVMKSNGTLIDTKLVDNCCDGTKVAFDLPALAKGMYIVKVQNDEVYETTNHYIDR